jgi:hypothetical protein
VGVEFRVGVMRVTRVLQGCYKGVAIVARVLQVCFVAHRGDKELHEETELRLEVLLLHTMEV